MAKVECSAYGGWDRCLVAEHEGRTVIVPSEVGPRILHWSCGGRPNVLKLYPEQSGITRGDEFLLLGGHRLWHAPEAWPRSYAPDLSPVDVAHDSARIELRQDVEASTGIRKSMQLSFEPGGRMRVVHELANESPWPVELAAWAMTIMADRTRLVIPQEPFAPHPQALQPARSLTLWSYTKMNDPRVSWGERYIQLREDAGVEGKFKLGLGNRRGWSACWSEGSLFIKTFAFDAEARYPDLGCNFETFTGPGILEVETLGPLRRLEPGASLRHEEIWHLWPLDELPDDERGLDRVLEPYLSQLQFPEALKSPVTR